MNVANPNTQPTFTRLSAEDAAMLAEGGLDILATAEQQLQPGAVERLSYLGEVASKGIEVGLVATQNQETGNEEATSYVHLASGDVLTERTREKFGLPTLTEGLAQLQTAEAETQTQDEGKAETKLAAPNAANIELAAKAAQEAQSEQAGNLINDARKIASDYSQLADEIKASIKADPLTPLHNEIYTVDDHLDAINQELARPGGPDYNTLQARLNALHEFGDAYQTAYGTDAGKATEYTDVAKVGTGMATNLTEAASLASTQIEGSMQTALATPVEGEVSKEATANKAHNEEAASASLNQSREIQTAASYLEDDAQAASNHLQALEEQFGYLLPQSRVMQDAIGSVSESVQLVLRQDVGQQQAIQRLQDLQQVIDMFKSNFASIQYERQVSADRVSKLASDAQAVVDMRFFDGVR